MTSFAENPFAEDPHVALGATAAGCRDLCLYLSAYLDGEAAADLCAAVEAHLAECPTCRLDLESLARTVSLARGLPAPELPPDMAERLHQALGLPPAAQG